MRPSPSWISASAGRVARDFASTVQHAATEFGRDRCTQMAAAIAFWALFSIFPLAMALVYVAGFFVDESTVQREVVEWITEYISLTSDGRSELERMLGTAVSGLGAVGLIGLVGLLWSASSLMSAVRNGIDAAWASPARRHFVRGKLLDLVLVVALGVLFAVSLTATFLARFALGLFDEGSVPDRIATEAWGLGTWLLPALLSFVTFLLAYRILPPVRTRFRDLWVGALVATTLFEVAKYGLTVYFERFSTYDEVYGSLGAVISFLFFVYVAAAILLFGAEFAAIWPRVRRGLYGGEGGPDIRSWLQEQIVEIKAPKPPDPRVTPGPAATPPGS